MIRRYQKAVFSVSRSYLPTFRSVKYIDSAVRRNINVWTSQEKDTALMCVFSCTKSVKVIFVAFPSPFKRIKTGTSSFNLIECPAAFPHKIVNIRQIIWFGKSFVEEHTVCIWCWWKTYVADGQIHAVIKRQIFYSILREPGFREIDICSIPVGKNTFTDICSGIQCMSHI